MAPGTRTPPRIGIEDEYQLIVGDRPVDARRVLPRLSIWGRPALDPVDPRARRTVRNHAVTADGWELEIATPPVPADAATSVRVQSGLAAEQTELLSEISMVLGQPSALHGFSTHVNVSVPLGDETWICEELVARFGVAVMLLTDLPESPGIVVRPRHGRVEVCLEFLDADARESAITLLTGAVALLLDAATDASVSVPTALDVRVSPGRERFGHYLDRTCVGSDLHASVRATRLATAEGLSLTGQDHLEEVWASTRRYAVALGLSHARLDSIVYGRLPLRLEMGGCGPAAATASSVSVPPSEPGFAEVSPGLVDRELPLVVDGLTYRVEWLTWERVAWAARNDQGRTAYIVVGVDRERELLEAIRAGRLSAVVRAALRPRLFASYRSLAPVLSDGPRVRPRLAPGEVAAPERDLVTGALREGFATAGGGGGPGGEGRAKDRWDGSEPSRSPVQRSAVRSRWLVPAAVGGLLLLAGGGAAVALSGSGGGSEQVAPTAPVATPPAAATPTTTPTDGASTSSASTSVPTARATAEVAGSGLPTRRVEYEGVLSQWGLGEEGYGLLLEMESWYQASCTETGLCEVLGFFGNYGHIQEVSPDGTPKVFEADYSCTENDVYGGSVSVTISGDTMVATTIHEDAGIIECPDGSIMPIGWMRWVFTGVREGSDAAMPVPSLAPVPPDPEGW